ncbi:hypothetical protein AV530_005214 [Patagioenas fasciata monilis]|uniref:Uncharacterized protein n=1 Tax=Patagioenas fasciata monilis TaxID=372326 RepID=A0A1V4JKG0_PATFA|nr:hypothetical protein AV530_005214 [Patagioenas fasciata monilis]
MEPKEIPDREAACWDAKSSSCIFSHECPPGSTQNSKKCKVSTNQDRYTIELAQSLAEEINKITDGFFPHIIINHLQRFKMDANREKDEASFGIPQAEQAWEEYMGFLTTAKSQMRGGLILDIHGQAHPERWIELGYTLSKTSLNSGIFFASYSSISHLASQLVNVSSETLVSGNRSLGKYIEDQNYSYVCVPSPSNPSPNNGSYYSGGYITKTFGSCSSGTIDAIQLELPQWGLFEETEPEALGNICRDTEARPAQNLLEPTGLVRSQVAVGYVSYLWNIPSTLPIQGQQSS